MRVDEQELRIPAPSPGGGSDLIGQLSAAVSERLAPDAVPLRVAITASDGDTWRCEVGSLFKDGEEAPLSARDVFRFRRRRVENVQAFNTVMLVPTGIGAEIGGHAGDATPAARLLATVSDTLLTHPNVVNGADLNEMRENTLYVEGSVLTRLLMGTVGLQQVRANRVLLLVDAHEDELFVNAAINAGNTARTAAGIDVVETRVMSRDMRMSAHYSASGRAVGAITGLGSLRQLIEGCRECCDALAITTLMDVSREMNDRYFESDGSVVNPFGGVEAMLTHAVSSLFQMPAAHAPMEMSRETANEDPGVLEPRIASEGISWPMVFSVLKGLHRSPRIVTDDAAMHLPGVLSAADLSCLVIPAGCLGLPTLAALQQGIPVIEVRDNRNLMRNDLERLPWRPGQLLSASSYLEAAGLIAALRAGIAPQTLGRGAGLGAQLSHPQA